MDPQLETARALTTCWSYLHLAAIGAIVLSVAVLGLLSWSARVRERRDAYLFAPLEELRDDRVDD